MTATTHRKDETVRELSVPGSPAQANWSTPRELPSGKIRPYSLCREAALAITEMPRSVARRAGTLAESWACHPAKWFTRLNRPEARLDVAMSGVLAIAVLTPLAWLTQGHNLGRAFTGAVIAASVIWAAGLLRLRRKRRRSTDSEPNVWAS
jgi:hypothetical protein